MVCLWIMAGEQSQGSLGYNITIFIVLLLTLLFANFAEAIAEARGKAQADSLRKTREETPAKKVFSVGEMRTTKLKWYHSSELKKGDSLFVKQVILFPVMEKLLKALQLLMNRPLQVNQLR